MRFLDMSRRARRGRDVEVAFEDLGAEFDAECWGGEVALPRCLGAEVDWLAAGDVADERAHDVHAVVGDDVACAERAFTFDDDLAAGVQARARIGARDDQVADFEVFVALGT